MMGLAAAVAALAGFLFGYDEGVIGGALHLLKQEFHFTPFTEGFMASAVPLGALIGVFLAGRLADTMGRKPVLAAAGLLFAGGAVWAALVQAAWMLVAARLILGLAVGFAAVVAPLYIAETVKETWRGAMVSLYQLLITIGILVSFLVDYFLAEAQAWRWMFGAGAIPGVIFFLGVLTIPESPRWLALKGHTDKARKALGRLRGEGDHAGLETEVNAILRTAEKDRQSQSGIGALFSPVVFPAVVVAFLLFVLQQLSGINAVIYYAPTIFKGAGLSSTGTQLLATIGVGTVNVLFTLVGMWLIDRIGRRKLAYIGFLGTALSLATLAVAANIADPTHAHHSSPAHVTHASPAAKQVTGAPPPTTAPATTEGTSQAGATASGADESQSVTATDTAEPSAAERTGAQVVAVVAVMVYIAAFAVALGPLPFVIMSEVFPLRLRGAGMAMASVANWGFNWLVVLFFPMASAALGLSGVMGAFAVVCLLGLLFTFFKIPETKGVLLEDIEAHLETRKPLSQLGKG